MPRRISKPTRRRVTSSMSRYFRHRQGRPQPDVSNQKSPSKTNDRDTSTSSAEGGFVSKLINAMFNGPRSQDTITITGITGYDVYNYVFDQIVYKDVPVNYVSKRLQNPVMDKIFDVFNVDVRGPSMKRAVEKAYNHEVNKVKKLLSQRKVHLMVDYFFKDDITYIGLSISYDQQYTILGVFDFEAGSPFDKEFPKNVIDRLQEFDLTSRIQLKSLKVYNNGNDAGNKGFDKLTEGLAKVFGKVPETSRPPVRVRKEIESMLKVGVKYCDDNMCQFLWTFMAGADDLVPDCTKEISYFKVNRITNFKV